MKILVVSDGHGGRIYGDALAQGFAALGHDVTTFKWQHYFKNYPYADVYETEKCWWKSVYYRAQNKYTFGPEIWRINRDLLKYALKTKPEMVFIYRGTHIYKQTIEKIKKYTRAKVVGYNNDDPFSSLYPWWFWRHFMRSVAVYDHIFCYRPKNMDDLRRMGYEKISLLRSYYLKEDNFKMAPLPHKKYVCDVIFIGHYENDGRDEALKALLDEGVKLKIFGTGWKKSILYNNLKEKTQGDIVPLYEDYNLALNSAKIALVFFSKLNHDSYTRRVFEISAAGTMMLSEYTEDMANHLFTADNEAVYFKNHAELMEKVHFYLKHDQQREAIAAAGHARVLRDGHEVIDRARKIVETVAAL